MSAPAFFRRLPPMKRKEIAPLIMLFLAATLIVIFAKVTEELLEGGLHGFDRAILLALRHADNPANPLGPLWLQVAARDVTSLGSPAVLTLITLAALGYLGLKRQWRAALFVLGSICGGTVVSSALKELVQRPRPDFVAAVAQTQTYSFPSGHAFLSAVTFLTLGTLLARVQRQAEVKIYLLAVAVAITVLVGISRVYIGVHWPTDVLAGWCAGAAWAILCWLIAERLQANNIPAS
ncbi:MAG: phosphatase PAP2 family protein [Rhodomicrobium sp.]